MLPAETRTPELEILINGGVRTLEDIDTHLQHVDGVMIGRRAYHNLPDGRLRRPLLRRRPPHPSREDILAAITPYIARSELADGNPHEQPHPPHPRPLPSQPGADAFANCLSDSRRLAEKRVALLQRRVRLRAESMKHHRLTCHCQRR